MKRYKTLTMLMAAILNSAARFRRDDSVCESRNGGNGGVFA